MKKIIFLMFITTLLFSCTDDISKYNVDPKNPVEVNAEYMFSYAQFNLAKQIDNASYNHNVDRFWANYATQTTYIQESSYDAANRDIGGSIFDNIYTENLYELKIAKKGILSQSVGPAEQAQKDNKIAMIKILEVYSYLYLVDNFGNIPYTEALDINNVTPKYDDAEFVYNAIIDSINSAVSMLTVDEPSFGSADLLYGGDVSKWKKFGHSLQLKIGTRLSNVNPAASSDLINDALYGGVFESNVDNVVFNYTGVQPYVNPIYSYFVIDSRNTDFVATENFLELLTDLSDPRVNAFYDDNLEDGMKGGVYGAAGNAYDELTHFNPAFTDDPLFPSTIMEYSTVCFELAEAAQRGTISGDASEYYAKGIRASFDALGVDGADAYISENPYVDTESIGIQKYISLFHNAHEAWTEARRTGIPQLAIAESNGVPNPKRMIYPVEEVLINTTNYNEAASAIGGDKTSSSIFWDID